MLELYHFDRSTAAQKVRIALAEKGLEWEGHYINTGFDKRDQHDPDYLKINPRGVVPTLIHDGKVIRESNVILEYLEDAFPAHPLRPADPFERAEMRRRECRTCWASRRSRCRRIRPAPIRRGSAAW